ncbi:endonuclease/exonuclease/phosphatase family protein [Cohnella fermenti]|uniref:Endonuclease n=1 Tax=Cohnella fermenti TaxID=2565925 RepID=A0A4S4C8E2_9BACL|nr:endonuclease/exonuclease/phosphatase family protein [Cohnella fermenti]THF84244.1 endonuclease [Cohnella fermenti]
MTFNLRSTWNPTATTPGRDGGWDGEHCAILYKKSEWRVVEQGSFALSDTPDRLGGLCWNAVYPRMSTWTRLRRPMSGADGAADLTTANLNADRAVEPFELAVFNTHLDDSSEESQTKGMEIIKARAGLLRQRAALPVVIAGDLNVSPGHPVIRSLQEFGCRDGYSAAAGSQEQVPGCTSHAFAGETEGEPIDYVFASPELRLESLVVDRSRHEGRYPSDHYPVVAKLSATP